MKFITAVIWPQNAAYTWDNAQKSNYAIRRSGNSMPSLSMSKVSLKIVQNITERSRRAFFKWRYLRVARRILDTPPLQIGALPFLLLSMVQKSDVLSYLVALKSFAFHANPRRVMVVCDPSIDDADRAVIRKHVPHAELYDAREFAVDDVPCGGTWERLLAISHHVADQYVVQLDADTVTLRPIPEVVAAICASKGFVLSEPNHRLMSLAETCAFASQFDSVDNHVQDVAEMKMVELERPSTELYIHGCSGFTGFPQAHGMREKLIAFSTEMRILVGSRWTAWGTEQVTSNYLVANIAGTTVLPVLRYAGADHATVDSVFLHFIGYTRFIDGHYERASAEAIRMLLGISD